jgi:hypothetical protein
MKAEKKRKQNLCAKYKFSLWIKYFNKYSPNSKLCGHSRKLYNLGSPFNRLQEFEELFKSSMQYFGIPATVLLLYRV